MQNSIFCIATAAAGTVLFAVGPAQAEPAQQAVVVASQDVKTVKVSFADLNLSSIAGRDRLNARVRGAVRRVCPASASMQLADLVRLTQCRQAAHARASGQIERITGARDLVQLEGGNATASL